MMLGLLDKVDWQSDVEINVYEVFGKSVSRVRVDACLSPLFADRRQKGKFGGGRR